MDARGWKVGDIIRNGRLGVEAEVVELHPNCSLLLCGWIDDSDAYQEVYFRAEDVSLVRAVGEP